MSALGRYFHLQGNTISGSDRQDSALINDLKKENINIWIPHDKELIKQANPDYVIYSTAILENNEELLWAKENKKQILHRSELLLHATKSKKIISISGTHGKTTTSAMTSEMLMDAGFHPSSVLGGILISKNTNVIVGNGEYFVIEGDESDKSFLKGEPEIAVITNIEADHLENYKGGLNEIKDSFLEFAKKGINKSGLVFCIDDKITKEIILKNFDLKNKKLISYGFYSEDQMPKISAKKNEENLSCDIYLEGKKICSLNPSTSGRHNILNSLAVFSCGYLLGIDFQKIKQTIENYKGTKRRFEFIYRSKELTIIDDYAHHPTEIEATIQAAKELNPERLLIVLQPHQALRLRDLWSDFIKVLKNTSDTLFVTDVYIARGQNIENISSQKLVEEVSKPNINYIPGSIEQIAGYLKKIIQKEDLILIMGAGDITYLCLKLIPSKTLDSKSGNN